MKQFNCSINRTFQADTEDDAIEQFKDWLESHKSSDIQVFEYESLEPLENHANNLV